FSSEAIASAAWSSGLLAFHTSHTAGNSSRLTGGPSPSAPGSDISAISAPLPRCDRTWALVQSRQYDRPRTCSCVMGSTKLARLSWDRLSVAIHLRGPSDTIASTSIRERGCLVSLPFAWPPLGWANGHRIRRPRVGRLGYTAESSGLRHGS